MKNEIKCPHCGTVFQVDEKDYESVIAQIKNHEFLEEVSKKEKELKEKLKTEIELVKAQSEANYNNALNKKENELHDLQIKLNELINKDAKNEQLKQKEINDVLNEKEKEIASLQKQLELAEDSKKSAIVEALAKEKENNQNNILKIASLENEIKNMDVENKLALSEAINKKEQEIAKLTNDITNNEKNYIEKENSLKSSYETQLKMKDEELERYKDFKAKQSTKLIGESLEQHCEIEYNRALRPILPNAYFEKDNVVSKETGSKGDFIFRDFDDEGNEYISIMFEMKNEADTTEKKHKNEDFFKELDKDRKEKKCEYAVLVSMLEADNELYNGGIVDVSYKYPKMYVIRPQFFISLITLIRNAAQKSIDYKKQLIVAQNQNIDITNFEENMETFKKGFSKNFELANKRFEEAIKEIDNSINHLQKIRDALTGSSNQLRLANDKAQDLSIKKLTKNAPSLREKFAEIKNK